MNAQTALISCNMACRHILAQQNLFMYFSGGQGLELVLYVLLQKKMEFSLKGEKKFGA